MGLIKKDIVQYANDITLIAKLENSEECDLKDKCLVSIQDSLLRLIILKINF